MDVARLQDDLLAWYAEHRRDLPWRETTDPYEVLVAEVMLQQTQVSRVVPKWEAFLEAFPTVDDLAAAPLRDVLDLWDGLGYNNRARYLKQAAEQVVSE
ncbi:MAG: A/G-specific adenine glycosylase, partial [Candidatus Nanohaloarchaea archaeon]